MSAARAHDAAEPGRVLLVHKGIRPLTAGDIVRLAENIRGLGIPDDAPAEIRTPIAGDRAQGRHRLPAADHHNNRREHRTMSQDIVIPGDEAYLSFGGWAKPMKNPPGLHERRRYVVDVECTDAALKTSSKGERGTRSLSILRVMEVAGVHVPPRPKNDEDDDTPPMFNDDGSVADDASADEGDEIMAERRERAEREAEDRARTGDEQNDAADDADEQEVGDPWPGDAAADADASDGDADEAEDPGEWDAEPARGNDGSGNVTSLFREAGNE